MYIQGLFQSRLGKADYALVTNSYQIFWEVVGLERGLLSLVSTTEELLERNSSGTGLGNREYVRRDPQR
jgi:hypothetical protein